METFVAHNGHPKWGLHKIADSTKRFQNRGKNSDTPIKWKYCILLLNALFYEKCGRTAFKCVTISGFSTSAENIHGQDKKKLKKL